MTTETASPIAIESHFAIQETVMAYVPANEFRQSRAQQANVPGQRLPRTLQNPSDFGQSAAPELLCGTAISLVFTQLSDDYHTIDSNHTQFSQGLRSHPLLILDQLLTKQTLTQPVLDSLVDTAQSCWQLPPRLSHSIGTLH